MSTRYDAIVVGVRCAGAATAMLLARQGLRVLAVDPRRPGSDTLSTHALMRGAVLQLHRWGLVDALEAAATPLVRRTSFHYGDEVLDIPIKPRDGIQGLYAPRRTVLDTVLAAAARDSGAEVVYGARMIDVTRDENGRVTGAVLSDSEQRLHRFESSIVIGADGVRSTVARAVGARRYRTGEHRTGNVYAYWSGLDLDGYHWYWRPGTSAGAIRTNEGLHCVFASVPAERFQNETRLDLETGYHRVIAECSPGLSEALSRAQRLERFRGFAGMRGFLRECWGPGWALVGDAGYFKDPLTAHGISDALRDAELLTDALLHASDYRAKRDELSLRLFQITDEIASFEWDLAAIQEKHLRLSEAMNHEVAWIASLDEPRVEVA